MPFFFSLSNLLGLRVKWAAAIQFKRYQTHYLNRECTKVEVGSSSNIHQPHTLLISAMFRMQLLAAIELFCSNAYLLIYQLQPPILGANGDPILLPHLLFYSILFYIDIHNIYNYYFFENRISLSSFEQNIKTRHLEKILDTLILIVLTIFFSALNPFKKVIKYKIFWAP